MDWSSALEIVAVIGGIATAMALILAPMFWLGSKIDNLSTSLNSFRAEMYQEMKDFHGRLTAIEENNKK